jgi:hypothetical protein
MRDFFEEIVTVPCDCGAEKITIEIEKEPPCADWAYFSIWTQRLHNQYTLGMKVRHILKIIADGNPYTDMMLLKADDCERLAEALMRTAKLLRENKRREDEEVEARRAASLDDDGFAVDAEGYGWKIEDVPDEENYVYAIIRRPDGSVIRNVVSKRPFLTK